MVEDALDDGVRIARLLASEVTGHQDPPLDDLAVANVEEDVEPEPDGARAYDVVDESEEGPGRRVASVFVHEDHAEFAVFEGQVAAREAAAAAGLATRATGDLETPAAEEQETPAAEEQETPAAEVDSDANSNANAGADASSTTLRVVVANGAAAKRAIDVIAAAIGEK